MYRFARSPQLLARTTAASPGYITQGDRETAGRLTLPDGATVVVVGCGPAGSFFAILALRKARELGRTLDLTILERKTEV